MRKNTFLIFLIALSLVSCGKPEPEPENKTVKIGILVPLDMPLVKLGAGISGGVRQRVSEANRKQELGEYTHLVLQTRSVYDNWQIDEKMQSPSSAYRNLVNEGVVAIIGPVTGDVCHEIISSIEASQTPTITPSATLNGLPGKSQYLFRNCFDDTFQAKALVDHAVRQQGLFKAAILTQKASYDASGLADAFKAAFIEAGGEIVSEQSYFSGDKSFFPQLKAIKKAGAEIVFLSGRSPDVPTILAGAEYIQMEQPFCGNMYWDDDLLLNNAGTSIFRSFFCAAFSATDPQPGTVEFIEAMNDRDVSPNSYTALGYDAADLIIKAIQTAGASDRASILQGLNQLETVDQITGPMQFNVEGGAIKSGLILGVEPRDGRAVRKWISTAKGE